MEFIHFFNVFIMRNLFFFIMTCLSMALMMACEQADVQRTSISDNEKIQKRDVPDDCDDCPVGDCCCLVTLVNGTSPASLSFCGTDDPDLSTTECEAGAGNCSIFGYTILRMISNLSPNCFFCMQPNTSFCLQGSSGAQLAITCQYGQLHPQTIYLTLGSNKVYYSVDGNCELEDCL